MCVAGSTTETTDADYAGNKTEVKLELSPSKSLPVDKIQPATVDLATSPDGKVGSPETVTVPGEDALNEVVGSSDFQVKPSPVEVAGNQSPKDVVLSSKDTPSESRTPPVGDSLSGVTPERPVIDSDAKGSDSDPLRVSDDVDKMTDNTGSPFHPKHGDSSERSKEPKMTAAPGRRSARAAMFGDVIRHALDPTQERKAPRNLASALNSRTVQTEKMSVPYPHSSHRFRHSRVVFRRKD